MTQQKLPSLGKMMLFSTATPKIRAGGGFLERQRRQPEDILAMVEVSASNYVPRGVELREWISPTMFTALIHANDLDDVLADEKVVLVQPSSSLGTYANDGA
jgi:hypothetical protein